MVALPSGMPEQVDDSELLARFIQQSNRIKGDRARHTLFLPHRGETSVFRHGAEPRASLWELGAKYLNPNVGKVYGAAVFQTRAVTAIGLGVRASEPPPRHAALRGWPTDPDADRERASWTRLAHELAASAQLVPVDQ